MINTLSKWQNGMESKQGATALLTGAKPWPGTQHPDHRTNAPSAKWTLTDIEDGDGVDLVADLHVIDKATDERFDGVYCPVTLEHVERPWEAVQAMANVMKPDGLLYIDTHQTFPLHGYPSDFYRFSAEALRSLCALAGLEVLDVEYDYPCTITPPQEITVWNPVAEAFLNVSVCARKPQ